jgi:hypothetical protein
MHITSKKVTKIKSQWESNLAALTPRRNNSPLGPSGCCDKGENLTHTYPSLRKNSQTGNAIFRVSLTLVAHPYRF